MRWLRDRYLNGSASRPNSTGLQPVSRAFRQFSRTRRYIDQSLGSLAAVTSVVTLVALIVYVGYDLSASDRRSLMYILRTAQLIFGAHILFRLIFYFRDTVRDSRIIKWIVDVAVILSLVAWMVPDMQHPWIPWLKQLALSRRTLFVVLGAYSIVDICYAMSYIPGRRTNPSLMMAVSFLLFIIIGSFVLMLPRCTYHGISYFDSLLVASSAVSITGLTSVDIPATFTPMGIIVLAVLIQLGSLGIITFTSFFAMFFTGNTSIYNQLLLRDVIYSKSMNALVPTLLYVLGFTLSIELLGAVCVYFTIPDTLGMSVEGRIQFALFHAMSSFCNAGFSILPEGMSTPALMQSGQQIYIVTSVLIFAGAVGFPILVNLREILRCYLRRAISRVTHRRRVTLPLHIYDLNTKIVLYTTLGVLAVGTVSFFVMEYNNTLRGMSLYDKVVQSVFNALVPRSAGYASVDPSRFLDITLLVVMVQMVIGGASQSMAGGIKVNTLGTVLLSLRSVVFGHRGVTAFHRTITTASVRRAHAVVVVAAISFIIYLSVMLLLEPALPAKAVVFETLSALFTVGSSLGITSELTGASKVVLSTAMFLGRVGILSMLMGFVGTTRDASEHYPSDNVIIN